MGMGGEGKRRLFDAEKKEKRRVSMTWGVKGVLARIQRG